MPPEGVCKREHAAICSLEELAELAAAFVELGIKKIRLTGGEPLVRRGIVSLVEQLAALKAAGLEELCMTTNGQRLAELAAPLRAAGLDRLNVSLDSLRPERYRALTRGGELDRVLAGIEAAEAAGFDRLSLNAVLLRGVNDDELRDLALLAKDRPRSVRFIELMPIGPGAGLDFLPAEAVLAAVPELREMQNAKCKVQNNSGVARLYTSPGWAGSVGLIASMSACFCETCSRVRLTADGKLKPGLHSAEEYPLRGLHGDALREAIQAAVLQKPARHHLSDTQASESVRPMNEIGG
jgi:cyclic pyranopterin phosphate synthase